MRDNVHPRRTLAVTPSLRNNQDCDACALTLLLNGSQAPRQFEDGVIMIESQTAESRRDSFQRFANAEKELRRLQFRKQVLDSIQVLPCHWEEGEQGKEETLGL